MRASPGALESGGISRWLCRVWASPGALECGGHLQVAEESRGITRWLWSVCVCVCVGGGASTGGFGECVHHQKWGHHQGLWRVRASPGGFGE